MVKSPPSPKKAKYQNMGPGGTSHSLPKISALTIHPKTTDSASARWVSDIREGDKVSFHALVYEASELIATAQMTTTNAKEQYILDYEDLRGLPHERKE